MSGVFITIPTYNGREYLEELFASVRAHAHGARIIVVDNASTDGTPDWILKHVAETELIRNIENRGFTGAQNQAMSRAIEHGAEFVFLLNQDTVLAPHALEELLAVARSRPRAGAVQSLLFLYGSNPEQVNSWGNAQHYLGFGYAKGYKQLIVDAPKEVIEIPYASGAAVLYRVSTLFETGLFPEHFFMYQEDLDLVWRMRLLDYEILLAPKSRVYHKYKWQGAAAKYALVERNRLATMYANYHWATLLLLLPALVLWEIALFTASFFTGWWRKKLQGYALMLGSDYRKATHASRARAQTLRKVSDREVTSFFTSIIDFQENSNAFVWFVVNPCLLLYWKLVRLVMFW